jgi:hypothetical protein
MKKTFFALIGLSVLCLSLAGWAAYASTPATVPTATPALAPDAQFFSTIPSTGELQAMYIPADEQALITAASLNSNVPDVLWTRAGWQLGSAIGASDDVPLDCALHRRQSVARQLYALCSGGQTITVPNGGADFIYVVLFGRQHELKKLLQAGRLYNPDATGLIP